MNIFKRDPDRQKELKHYFVYWFVMIVIFLIIIYALYSFVSRNFLESSLELWFSKV